MNGEDQSVEITAVDGVEVAGHADDEGARHAVARGRVTMQAKTAASVTANTLKKGDALSAVTIAALTVYDMCKSADCTMMIGAVELFETSGRGLGLWRRGEDDPDGEI